MGNSLRVLCSVVALAACFSLPAPVGAARQQPRPPAAGEDDPVYKGNEVDERAVIKRRPPADLVPGEGRCVSDEGVVRLRVVLRRSGEVTDVTVVRASGCPEFDERAAAALRKVVFTPAKKGGRHVSQSALFEYSYRIG